MPRKKKAPELTFQQHSADFLVREHGYGGSGEWDALKILS